MRLRELILKNTSWLALGETISMAIGFVLAIILARYLGDEVFGQYSFIFSFVFLFATLAYFGIATISTKEIAQNPEKSEDYFSNILSLKVIFVILAYFGVFIFSQFLGKPNEIKNLIYLAGFCLIFRALSHGLCSLFRAHQKFFYEALTKILEYPILLGLIILIVLSKGKFSLIIWAYVFSSLIGLIGALILVRIYFLKKIKFGFDFSFWKKVLVQAWPIALASTFVAIYFKIDTIMLSLMKTDRVVGWYNAAYNLTFALLFLPNLIMVSFFPEMSKIFKNHQNDWLKFYQKSLGLMAVLGLVVSSIVFLGARIIILIIYGSTYLASIPALKILAPALFFSYLSHVFLFSLISVNRQIIYTGVTFFGAVFNLGLNFIFIPRYSYLGAAFTTLLTEAVTAILLFIFIQKLLKKYK